MAINFRPMSFHCSTTACVGFTAAFGGSFFFAASCAPAGTTANPAPSTRVASTFHFFISFLLSFARKPDVLFSDAPLCRAFPPTSVDSDFGGGFILRSKVVPVMQNPQGPRVKLKLDLGAPSP